jgi:glucose 1-dehydrogenase
MMRRVVVTGVGGGIGRATAELFHKESWDVVGCDRMPWDGPPILSDFVLVDFADARETEVAFGELASTRVDALVNNAGVSLSRTLVETTVDDWDHVMGVNVRAAFVTTRCLVPALRDGGGVVNVSSVHAVATTGQVTAYAASKGALLALTRASALELADDQIRVNAVLPGAVDTPMLRAGLVRLDPVGDADTLMGELAGRTPMRRIGDPGEIAQAILFLADSARSGFCTGQALVVDGGATSRLSTE